MFLEKIFDSSLLIVAIYCTLLPVLIDIAKRVVFPEMALKWTAYVFLLITLGSFIIMTIKELYPDKLINIEKYFLLPLIFLFIIGLLGIFYVTHNLFKKTI